LVVALGGGEGDVTAPERATAGARTDEDGAVSVVVAVARVVAVAVARVVAVAVAVVAVAVAVVAVAVGAASGGVDAVAPEGSADPDGAAAAEDAEADGAAPADGTAPAATSDAGAGPAPTRQTTRPTTTAPSPSQGHVVCRFVAAAAASLRSWPVAPSVA
jgi:hypothetical protein